MDNPAKISRDEAAAIAEDFESTLTVVSDLVSIAARTESASKARPLLCAADRYLDDLYCICERLEKLCGKGKG